LALYGGLSDEYPCRLSLSTMRSALVAVAVIVAVASAQREAIPECGLKCLDEDPDVAEYCAGVYVPAPHLPQAGLTAEANISTGTQPFVSAQTTTPSR